MPDDLRTLIERVEKAGGPLNRNEYGLWRCNGIPKGMIAMLDTEAEWCQNVLAGVLRRDMAARGLRVIHDHDPYDVPNSEHGVSVWDEGDNVHLHNAHFGADTLTAHLLAWLSAHERGLVGRQEATNA